MDAVMEIENEPRSSLERDLMDRDREGQLYLETRRQRALVDLLDINRTSFLSTITPPSTNPPSAASSLFQEPLATPTHTEAFATRSPANTPPHSAERPAAAAEATASSAYTTPSRTPATATAIHNIIPAIKKKTRQRSPSGRGRTLVPELDNRPVVSISTSSLEYQLTANLLKLHHAPPSSSGTRSRSRSRSKPRPHKPRSATLSHDARIDTQAIIMTTSRGTGHARARETNAEEQEVLQDDLEVRTGASTSVTIPSSPSSSMFGPPSPFLPSSSEQNRAGPLMNTGTVPPSVPRSPPLPPLPPKSPRSLIAHYFPGSLPPPPARSRPRHVQKNLVLAPRPFKTPTFGPAFASKPRVASTAPPLPSSSSSLQYITALPPPAAAAMDDTLSISSPSPSISALGPTFSATSIEQPRGLPSDLDLSISTSARAWSHLQDHHQQLYPVPHHSNNSSISVEEGRDLASLSLSLSFSSSSPFSVSFSNLADSEVLSSTQLSNNIDNNNNNNNNNNISSTKTTWVSSSVIPIYPRDLMPITSANMSGSSTSNSMSLNLNSGGPQKLKSAVPYVRELIPGREDSPDSHNLEELLTATSPNTSRDLEMVLEEITGRIYTTRTSMGPWSSPLPASYFQDDEKSLPPIRREKGSRYWVFRTADGNIVPGPFLFLLGHLCPVLWWIGSVYPSIEHPDDKHRQKQHQQYHQQQQQQQCAVVPSRSRKNSIAAIASERRLSYDEPISLAAQAGTTQDLAENPVVQWLQRHLRAAGVRIASITTTARSSSPCPSSYSASRPPQTTNPEQMATLQVVRISQEVPDRDSEPPEAGLTGHMSNNSSWIHVPARLLFPPLSTTAAAHAHHVAPMMTTTMPMVDDGMDTHGPWSAEDNAAYLFELRMARDRKLLRYELDLSWRRINLIWSLGSFVLALSITAVVLAAT